MKILIIYDSTFGNTRKVVQALSRSVKWPHKVRLLRAPDVTIEDIEHADMILVGSPTQGGQATTEMRHMLKELPGKAFVHKRVAAFDTRFAMQDHGLGLKIIMKTLGFAAPHIARTLQEMGGKLITEPEGFIVEDKQGPLKVGELQRAEKWMDEIMLRQHEAINIAA